MRWARYVCGRRGVCKRRGVCGLGLGGMVHILLELGIFPAFSVDIDCGDGTDGNKRHRQQIQNS